MHKTISSRQGYVGEFIVYSKQFQLINKLWPGSRESYIWLVRWNKKYLSYEDMHFLLDTNFFTFDFIGSSSNATTTIVSLGEIYQKSPTVMPQRYQYGQWNTANGLNITETEKWIRRSNMSNVKWKITSTTVSMDHYCN